MDLKIDKVVVYGLRMDHFNKKKICDNSNKTDCSSGFWTSKYCVINSFLNYHSLQTHKKETEIETKLNRNRKTITFELKATSIRNLNVQNKNNKINASNFDLTSR